MLLEKVTGEVTFKPCYSWGCEICGPRRLAELSRRMQAALKLWPRIYMLTVTLAPERGGPSSADGTREQARYGSKCLRRLLEAWNAQRRREGLPRLRVIKIIEWREGSDAWHAHCLVDAFRRRGRYKNPVPGTLRAWAWRAGLGKVLEIRHVRVAQAAARYLAGYVTKSVGHEPPKYTHKYSSTRGAMPTIDQWRYVRRSLECWTEKDGWWLGENGEAIGRAVAEARPEPGRFKALIVRRAEKR